MPAARKSPRRLRANAFLRAQEEMPPLYGAEVLHFERGCSRALDEIRIVATCAAHEVVAKGMATTTESVEELVAREMAPHEELYAALMCNVRARTQHLNLLPVYTPADTRRHYWDY